MFFGTQYIAEQICKSFCRLRFIKNNAHVFDDPNCDKRVNSQFLKLMNQCKIKNCVEYRDDLRIFGKSKTIKLSVVEKVLLEELVGETIHEKCKTYQRFICNRILIHTCNYKRLKKRHNSTVVADDDEIMIISHLLKINCMESNNFKYVIMGENLEELDEVFCKSNIFSSSNYSFITNKSGSIVCYNYSSIKAKAVNIYSENRNYVFPIVNKFEMD